MDHPSAKVSRAGARYEASNDEIVLGMLDVVERNPSSTQRSVASELGVALGLVNAYLKRCIRKGYIKVKQVPRRRYAYYLTPQGFAEKSRLTASYLSNSFSFFRRARAECNELFVAAVSHGQWRLALIGESELAEIARLVSREHAIRIIGTAPSMNSAAQLVSAVGALGPVDAVVITALHGSSGVYSAAVAAFGRERVYAPALLRLRAVADAPIPNREAAQ